MKRRQWTDAELQLLRQEYADASTAALATKLVRPVAGVYAKAAQMGLAKSAAFLRSVQSGRIMRGRKDPRMTATQFAPGQTPWNKGVPGSTGLHENCRRNQFKPGSIPHTTLPVGSYRINKDGHLQRKIGTAKGSNSMRWRGVAELVWIEANGPLPPGHIVVFRPGMKTAVLEEITIERVECISKAENARRNHPRNKHPELARLVQLKGAITRQVNRIRKQQQESHA